VLSEVELALDGEHDLSHPRGLFVKFDGRGVQRKECLLPTSETRDMVRFYHT
jgi:hypothetical protein